MVVVILVAEVVVHGMVNIPKSLEVVVVENGTLVKEKTNK
jgi:hypothetical protein